MGCKKISLGRFVCGMAAGALALTPMVAHSDMSGGAGGGMGGSMSMSAAPSQVTGTVQRYYVDRAGNVTAMDIQTANGVQFVRFAPGMGQRLYTTYPVGGQAQVWVTQDAGGWTMVSMGTNAPSSAMMGAMTAATAAAWLDAEPYIQVGQGMISTSGSLRNLIVNNEGEVVALLLGDNRVVRIPREFRHHAPGHAGTERVATLFRGALVEVTGYPEAPRYGVVSAFGTPIIAQALTINSRNVGAIGIPMMSAEQRRSLFPGIGGPDISADELRAREMGYSPYAPGAPGAMEPTMTAPGGTAR